MKKIALVCALCAFSGFAGAFAQTRGSVDISFSYARQQGPGSNQFAVWVEDAEGRYIKTLYATRFTARGGWERRPESIRQWVKKSALSSLSASEVDAFTSATPREGAQRFRWDGTDSRGKAVPAGNYVIYIEGSLRGESRVVYSALLRLGEASGDVEVKAQYHGSAGSERGMLTDVKVKAST
ncbi:MAG: DUF2271 domain-containing protein [Spirochaetales bacterium]|nr:DUF2271 domain-containing protein [Spirochaetales bacterium]